MGNLVFEFDGILEQRLDSVECVRLSGRKNGCIIWAK